MSKYPHDTFEFSGDCEWAMWRRGVLCARCFGDSGYKTEVEAIGLSVRQDPDRILIEPLCESCAADEDILLFQEDN